MGGFCLLVELHREGFAPAACAACLFLSRTVDTILQTCSAFILIVHLVTNLEIILWNVSLNYKILVKFLRTFLDPLTKNNKMLTPFLQIFLWPSPPKKCEPSQKKRILLGTPSKRNYCVGATIRIDQIFSIFRMLDFCSHLLEVYVLCPFTKGLGEHWTWEGLLRHSLPFFLIHL